MRLTIDPTSHVSIIELSTLLSSLCYYSPCLQKPTKTDTLITTSNSHVPTCLVVTKNACPRLPSRGSAFYLFSAALLSILVKVKLCRLGPVHSFGICCSLSSSPPKSNRFMPPPSLQAMILKTDTHEWCKACLLKWVPCKISFWKRVP